MKLNKTNKKLISDLIKKVPKKTAIIAGSSAVTATTIAAPVITSVVNEKSSVMAKKGDYSLTNPIEIDGRRFATYGQLLQYVQENSQVTTETSIGTRQYVIYEGMSQRSFGSYAEVMDYINQKYVKRLSVYPLSKTNWPTSDSLIQEIGASQFVETKNEKIYNIYKTANGKYTLSIKGDDIADKNARLEAAKTYIQLHNAFYYDGIYFSSKADVEDYIVTNQTDPNPILKRTSSDMKVLQLKNGVYQQFKDFNDVKGLIASNAVPMLRDSGGNLIPIDYDHLNDIANALDDKGLSVIPISSNDSQVEQVVDMDRTTPNGQFFGPYISKSGLGIEGIQDPANWSPTSSEATMVSYKESLQESMLTSFIDYILFAHDISSPQAMMNSIKLVGSDDTLFDFLNKVNPHINYFNLISDFLYNLSKGTRFSALNAIILSYSFIIDKMVQNGEPTENIITTAKYFDSISSALDSFLSIALSPIFVKVGDGTKNLELNYFRDTFKFYDEKSENKIAPFQNDPMSWWRKLIGIGEDPLTQNNHNIFQVITAYMGSVSVFMKQANEINDKWLDVFDEIKFGVAVVKKWGFDAQGRPNVGGTSSMEDIQDVLEKAIGKDRANATEFKWMSYGDDFENLTLDGWTPFDKDKNIFSAKTSSGDSEQYKNIWQSLDPSKMGSIKFKKDGNSSALITNKEIAKNFESYLVTDQNNIFKNFVKDVNEFVDGAKTEINKYTSAKNRYDSVYTKDFGKNLLEWSPSSLMLKNINTRIYDRTIASASAREKAFNDSIADQIPSLTSRLLDFNAKFVQPLAIVAMNTWFIHAVYKGFRENSQATAAAKKQAGKDEASSPSSGGSSSDSPASTGEVAQNPNTGAIENISIRENGETVNSESGNTHTPLHRLSDGENLNRGIPVTRSNPASGAASGSNPASNTITTTADVHVPADRGSGVYEDPWPSDWPGNWPSDPEQTFASRVWQQGDAGRQVNLRPSTNRVEEEDNVSTSGSESENSDYYTPVNKSGGGASPQSNPRTQGAPSTAETNDEDNVPPIPPKADDIRITDDDTDGANAGNGSGQASGPSFSPQKSLDKLDKVVNTLNGLGKNGLDADGYATLDEMAADLNLPKPTPKSSSNVEGQIYLSSEANGDDKPDASAVEVVAVGRFEGGQSNPPVDDGSSRSSDPVPVVDPAKIKDTTDLYFKAFSAISNTVPSSAMENFTKFANSISKSALDKFNLKLRSIIADEDFNKSEEGKELLRKLDLVVKTHSNLTSKDAQGVYKETYGLTGEVAFEAWVGKITSARIDKLNELSQQFETDNLVVSDFAKLHNIKLTPNRPPEVKLENIETAAEVVEKLGQRNLDVEDADQISMTEMESGELTAFNVALDDPNYIEKQQGARQKIRLTPEIIKLENKFRNVKPSDLYINGNNSSEGLTNLGNFLLNSEEFKTGSRIVRISQLFTQLINDDEAFQEIFAEKYDTDISTYSAESVMKTIITEMDQSVADAIRRWDATTKLYGDSLLIQEFLINKHIDIPKKSVIELSDLSRDVIKQFTDYLSIKFYNGDITEVNNSLPKIPEMKEAEVKSLHASIECWKWLKDQGITVEDGELIKLAELNPDIVRDFRDYLFQSGNFNKTNFKIKDGNIVAKNVDELAKLAVKIYKNKGVIPIEELFSLPDYVKDELDKMLKEAQEKREIETGEQLKKIEDEIANIRYLQDNVSEGLETLLLKKFLFMAGITADIPDEVGVQHLPSSLKNTFLSHLSLEEKYYKMDTPQIRTKISNLKLAIEIIEKTIQKFEGKFDDLPDSQKIDFVRKMLFCNEKDLTEYYKKLSSIKPGDVDILAAEMGVAVLENIPEALSIKEQFRKNSNTDLPIDQAIEIAKDSESISYLKPLSEISFFDLIYKPFEHVVFTDEEVSELLQIFEKDKVQIPQRYLDALLSGDPTGIAAALEILEENYASQLASGEDGERVEILNANGERPKIYQKYDEAIRVAKIQGTQLGSLATALEVQRELLGSNLIFDEVDFMKMAAASPREAAQVLDDVRKGIYNLRPESSQSKTPLKIFTARQIASDFATRGVALTDKDLALIATSDERIAELKLGLTNLEKGNVIMKTALDGKVVFEQNQYGRKFILDPVAMNTMFDENSTARFLTKSGNSDFVIDEFTIYRNDEHYVWKDGKYQLVSKKAGARSVESEIAKITHKMTSRECNFQSGMFHYRNELGIEMDEWMRLDRMTEATMTKSGDIVVSENARTFSSSLSFTGKYHSAEKSAAIEALIDEASIKNLYIDEAVIYEISRGSIELINQIKESMESGRFKVGKFIDSPDPNHFTRQIMLFNDTDLRQIMNIVHDEAFSELSELIEEKNLDIYDKQMERIELLATEELKDIKLAIETGKFQVSKVEELGDHNVLILENEQGERAVSRSRFTGDGRPQPWDIFYMVDGTIQDVIEAEDTHSVANSGEDSHSVTNSSEDSHSVTNSSEDSHSVTNSSEDSGSLTNVSDDTHSVAGSEDFETLVQREAFRRQRGSWTPEETSRAKQTARDELDAASVTPSANESEASATPSANESAGSAPAARAAESSSAMSVLSTISKATGTIGSMMSNIAGVVGVVGGVLMAITQVIDMINNFDTIKVIPYAYQTTTGETYYWNGAETESKFWGLDVQQNTTIKNLKLINNSVIVSGYSANQEGVYSDGEFFHDLAQVRRKAAVKLIKDVISFDASNPSNWGKKASSYDVVWTIGVNKIDMSSDDLFPTMNDLFAFLEPKILLSSNQNSSLFDLYDDTLSGSQQVTLDDFKNNILGNLRPIVIIRKPDTNDDGSLNVSSFSLPLPAYNLRQKIDIPENQTPNDYIQELNKKYVIFNPNINAKNLDKIKNDKDSYDYFSKISNNDQKTIDALVEGVSNAMRIPTKTVSLDQIRQDDNFASIADHEFDTNTKEIFTFTTPTGKTRFFTSRSGALNSLINDKNLNLTYKDVEVQKYIFDGQAFNSIGEIVQFVTDKYSLKLEDNSGGKN